MILIGIKVIYLCYMMILAIIAYAKKKESILTFETAVCAFYFLEVIYL